MTTFDDVFDAAQHLPTSERLRLLDALRESVPLDEWPVPSDAWIAEAQRRSDACDAGRMTASPADEVRARARKKAGLDG